jgi:importin subunit alpha-1
MATNIIQKAVWALGNIAGDSLTYRKVVLDHNTLQVLHGLILRELREYDSMSTLKIAIWALSNLCRGNGTTDLDTHLIQIALPIIETFLNQFSDDELLMDACWALARTLRGLTEKTTEIVVGDVLCMRIVDMAL